MKELNINVISVVSYHLLEEVASGNIKPQYMSSFAMHVIYAVIEPHEEIT